MRYALMSVFVIIGHMGCAQTQLISGMIVDERGMGLYRAKVHQIDSYFHQFSDRFGGFHFVVDSLFSDTIVFSELNCQDKFITNLDTISGPLTIVLLDDNSGNLYKPAPNQHPDKSGMSKVQITLSFMGDINDYDFSEFEPIIGSFGLEKMQNSGAFIGGEIGVGWRSFYWGGSYGFMQSILLDFDSLHVRSNDTQYGLHFGYELLNTNRFRVMPRVGLKWTRFRLIQSSPTHRVPIEQHLDDRDLDLRFNQLTGFAGLRIAYKMYYDGFMDSDYVEFGAYFGYHFAFNDVPWVYSSRNRLLTDRELRVTNMSGGVHVTFFFN